MGSLLFSSLLVNGGRNAFFFEFGWWRWIPVFSCWNLICFLDWSHLAFLQRWLGCCKIRSNFCPGCIVLGARVKVERFKTAVRKGKLKKVGSTSLFSAEEGFFQGYSNGEITTIPPAGRKMLASWSNNESRSNLITRFRRSKNFFYWMGIGFLGFKAQAHAHLDLDPYCPWMHGNQKEKHVYKACMALRVVNVRSMLLLACMRKSVRLKLLSYLSRRMKKQTPRLMGARSIMKRP